jgi:hypothetical protein
VSILHLRRDIELIIEVSSKPLLTWKQRAQFFKLLAFDAALEVVSGATAHFSSAIREKLDSRSSSTSASTTIKQQLPVGSTIR